LLEQLRLHQQTGSCYIDAAAVAEKQSLGLQSCIIYKRDHVRLLQQQHLHQQTGSCYTLRQQQLQRNKTLIAELAATTRERERERERDVSGSQNSIWVKEQSQHSAEHEVSLSFTHKQTCPHKKSLEKMQ
jgi:hypothetical protein